VLRTYTGDDMDAHENKGGGRGALVCCWILKIEENKAQRLNFGSAECYLSDSA
jgi:hypothetical protein